MEQYMNTQTIITALISYILGFVSGGIVSIYLKKQIKDVSYKNVVLVIVSVMWTLSVAVELINPNYNTSPMIHGLMGSIVGFFYKFEPKKGK